MGENNLEALLILGHLQASYLGNLGFFWRTCWILGHMGVILRINAVSMLNLTRPFIIEESESRPVLTQTLWKILLGGTSSCEWLLYELYWSQRKFLRSLVLCEESLYWLNGLQIKFLCSPSIDVCERPLLFSKESIWRRKRQISWTVYSTCFLFTHFLTIFMARLGLSASGENIDTMTGIVFKMEVEKLSIVLFHLFYSPSLSIQTDSISFGLEECRKNYSQYIHEPWWFSLHPSSSFKRPLKLWTFN